MRLELDPADVRALLAEDGNPSTFAFVQQDGELLVRVGGVTLGTPAEVDGKLVFDHDFPAEAVALLKSRAVTRKAVVGDAAPTDLEDAEFAAWKPGLALAVGDVLRYGDGEDAVAYEVIQAHTSQADWPPPAVPALFKRLRAGSGGQPGAPAEWVQPQGAHDAYNTGDRVTYQGSVYESLIDGNVWSPTAYPAGWLLIE